MDINQAIKNFNSKYNLLTILGPTASGKTTIAANLAFLINAEIISADSRQVYKYMDLGTGKDLQDYSINNFDIPYHLIDVVDAGEKYNLFNFYTDFFNAFENISSRNKIPLLCGGTGLYIETIIRNFDLQPVPENSQLRADLETKTLEELTEILTKLKKLHNKTDIDTKKRAIRAIEIQLYSRYHNIPELHHSQINSLNIGIKYDRELQTQKITQRLKTRIDEGMIQEVQNLLEKGIPSETLIYYGLEYKFVTQYLLGQITFDEMFNLLNIAIHQFSKRQMTFFRHLERKDAHIHWIDGLLPLSEKINNIIEIISK